jgi:hypothetical protein
MARYSFTWLERCDAGHFLAHLTNRLLAGGAALVGDGLWLPQVSQPCEWASHGLRDVPLQRL